MIVFEKYLDLKNPKRRFLVLERCKKGWKALKKTPGKSWNKAV